MIPYLTSMDPGLPSENFSCQQFENCPLCGTALDITDIEPLSTIACPGCGSEIQVGNFIGPFQLVALAGRGGMGVVYRALDSGLNREVALKVLKRDDSGSSELIEKLAVEAAITATINHPHVVRVFSTGLDAGRFYLAMELVDKGSLDDLIRIQGGISELQALQVGIQIAMGLKAALQHNLIHRDVKPANILFSEPDSAKIVDFGLALFMEQEESARGEVWGTPYYVAPEKLDGKPEDFRSDIYSLGGTLFHALTGRPPFEAPNASLVAYKHLKSQPVRLQAFAPHVSSRTAYIIDRTLLKDPDQRYQSYDELIEHLQYARDELLAGKPDATPQRIVLEDPSENKASVVFAGIILLLILSTAVFGLRSCLKSSGSGLRKLAAEPALVQEGRNELSAGHPKEAVSVFRKYVSQTAQDEDYVAVSAFLGAVAAMETGDTEAVGSFLATLQKVAAHPKKKAVPLTAALFESGKILKTPETSPDMDQLKTVPKGDPRSLCLLASALARWKEGHLASAVELLRDFRLKAPVSDFKWMEGLVAVAVSKVDDFTVYRMEMDRVKKEKTPEAKRFVSFRLAELEPDLFRLAEAELKAQGVSDPLQPGTIAVRSAPLFLDEFGGFPREDAHKVETGKWASLSGVLGGEPENRGGDALFWRFIPSAGGVVLEIRFRLVGATSMSVGFTSERSKLFELSLTDGKSTLSSPSSPANGLRWIMDNVLSSEPCEISPDKWHLLRLEVVDDQIAVAVDGLPAGCGKNRDIGRNLRGSIFFTAKKGRAELRELYLWSAQAKNSSVK
jgi:serine/threonine protein kinase